MEVVEAILSDSQQKYMIKAINTCFGMTKTTRDRLCHYEKRAPTQMVTYLSWKAGRYTLFLFFVCTKCLATYHKTRTKEYVTG